MTFFRVMTSLEQSTGFLLLFLDFKSKDNRKSLGRKHHLLSPYLERRSRGPWDHIHLPLSPRCRTPHGGGGVPSTVSSVLVSAMILTDDDMTHEVLLKHQKCCNYVVMHKQPCRHMVCVFHHEKCWGIYT